MLEFSVFGEIHVQDGDRHLGPRDLGGIKSKQILEILLLNRGHTVSKDSLADFLCFGVAPAFTLYVWSLQRAGGFGYTPCLMFAVCMALRLARFFPELLRGPQLRRPLRRLASICAWLAMFNPNICQRRLIRSRCVWIPPRAAARSLA